jgi:hypothetical protein
MLFIANALGQRTEQNRMVRKRTHEALVRGYQFTLLAFDKRNVTIIVNADACLRRQFGCSWQQRQPTVKGRKDSQGIGQELQSR